MISVIHSFMMNLFKERRTTMLYNMEDLLKVAQQHHFAVGAFNVCDSELFRCVMDAAEEQHAPVIIELAPPEMEYVGSSFFHMVLDRMMKSKIPCVLHLDHGITLQDCMEAIRYGFTSVMIDGSKLSYEDNIMLTRSIVEIAHPVAVSVEGEIGTIGAMSNSVEGGVDQISYTQPLQAKEFIEKTGVDTLAIAIGTAHGIYPSGFVPKLRLDILREVNQLVDKPLVLHGGSSNADEEIKEACMLGICKVNIASDYRKAFFQTIEATLPQSHAFWSPTVYKEAIVEAKAIIAHKMKLFGCVGKAEAYK